MSIDRRDRSNLSLPRDSHPGREGQQVCAEKLLAHLTGGTGSD